MPAQIIGFDEQNKRISTQQLLQKIYAALENGETEFEVLSSGHHDIGGPLWTGDGTALKFRVKNPGQRVGSFGLDGTEIVVEGSAPADAGWLNAGATLTILGDGGDTTAHCAASGKIYVGGRVGTRSGSLMKHDPAYDAPEFWVLKNTGSFCFEFMGGGIAVICGLGCEQLESVMGDRACMGMVGGTIYVRGPVQGLSDDVWLLDLDEGDRAFLSAGLEVFLGKIGRPQLQGQLTDFGQWRKIVAKSYEERKIHHRITMREFRLQKWVEGGIFGDVVYDDYNHVAGLVNTGDDRLKIPRWQDKKYGAPCQTSCPSAIPTQDRINLLRAGKVKEALELVLRYSPFPGSVCGEVCPTLKHLDLIHNSHGEDLRSRLLAAYLWPAHRERAERLDLSVAELRQLILTGGFPQSEKWLSEKEGAQREFSSQANDPIAVYHPYKGKGVADGDKMAPHKWRST